jgi:hypothetical protein
MNNPQNPDELRELENLPNEIEPPAALEERLVGQLKREGLIEASSSKGMSPWLMAAACLVAALIGWTARGFQPAAAGVGAEGSSFLILLSEPEPLQTSKPMAELVAEYGAWAGGLAEENRLVAAGHLTPERMRLASIRSPSSEEPSQLDLDTLTGFFVVRADDLAQAAKIAESSPHIGYGGEIAVRAIAAPGT